MKIHLKERAKRFYGNQHVKRYCRNPFRKYVVNPTVKATKVTLFLVAAAYIFILVGHILNSAYGEDKAQAFELATSTSATSTPTTKETFKEIYENYPFPPFLAKICKAEHAGGHYRYGQVVINATQDMGACQINVPIWGKKAHDMGYDLPLLEDNKQFALYLFLNYGTQPWNSSRDGKNGWGNN
jgi:hypothetical protein